MSSYTLTSNGVEYITNRPTGLGDKTKDPLIIGVHGDSRDNKGLFDSLVKAAGSRKVLIVCPLFRTTGDPVKAGLAVWTEDSWKRGDSSNTGLSTFTALERFSVRPSTIVGHSAGGQLIQRWAYVAPANSNRLIVANPGTYMWHTNLWAYKYGLAKLPSQMTSRTITDRPFTLLLGDQDIDPADTSLDTSTAAMWQGPNRYVRGQNYARDHKITYTTVPGIGHTASGMFRSAAGVKAIFG